MTLEICIPRLIRLQNVILYNFLPKDIRYYFSLYSLYQYLRYFILFNTWSFSNIIVANELLFIALNYSLWKIFDLFWTATGNSFHFIGFCYWTSFPILPDTQYYLSLCQCWFWNFLRYFVLLNPWSFSYNIILNETLFMTRNHSLLKCSILYKP